MIDKLECNWFVVEIKSLLKVKEEVGKVGEDFGVVFCEVFEEVFK